jgi:hypothetical protein
MHTAGYILLIIGFLLCLVFNWIAIGFFIMGFGLIFLLIVDERLKPPKLNLGGSDIQFGSTRPVRSPTVAEQNALPICWDQAASSSSEIGEWESLTKRDQDLSRITSVLLSFGQKYVEQLAKAYLAFNDKAYLPIILDMVVASARKDAAFERFESQTNPTSKPEAQSDNFRETDTLDAVGVLWENGIERQGEQKATRSKPKGSFLKIVSQPAVSAHALHSVARDEVVTGADHGSPSVQEVNNERESLKSLFDLLVSSAENKQRP